MKVTYFTREYPPHIYGGAGVHIENLAREVSRRMKVEVRCFGEQKSDDPDLTVKGYGAWPRMWEGEDKKFNSTLGTFSTDMSMIRDHIDSELVHTHTWYAAMAGYFAKVLYDIPFVATVHSLEPLRPWKEEQLGRSYHLTSWIERVALENADRIVAVSNQSRGEILDNFEVDPKRVVVIHNGIDLGLWRHVERSQTREAYGLMDEPYILFVGRTSRQKGLVHLIDAMKFVDPGVKLVCCTSAPDTPEIEEEIAAKVREEPRCVWINTMLRKDQYIELYSQCSVFACPSVYEPFGIINLEAMACERPVVASAVGGIQEVVVPGETGFLVPPADPKALAESINKVLRDPEMARRMGLAGRQRVVDHFSWSSIAEKTVAMYRELVDEWRAGIRK
ncbi:MAG: glycogen synthase [Myxococcales bacterium]|jgi:glycogen synthase|nr:glycogen synthase [Myxococcales bacterium]